MMSWFQELQTQPDDAQMARMQEDWDCMTTDDESEATEDSDDG